MTLTGQDDVRWLGFVSCGPSSCDERLAPDFPHGVGHVCEVAAAVVEDGDSGNHLWQPHVNLAITWDFKHLSIRKAVEKSDRPPMDNSDGGIILHEVVALPHALA